MRFVVDTSDGTVTVAQLDDGRVLLKVRAHGAQLTAADAFTLSAMLTRVAIEAHLEQVERSLGILARSMRDPVAPHLAALGASLTESGTGQFLHTDGSECRDYSIDDDGVATCRHRSTEDE